MNNNWGEIPNRENFIVTSPSKLVCLRESAELYKYRYIDKQDEKTAPMKFGTLCHMAVLEPAKFADLYTRLPEITQENDLSLTELKEKAKELGLTVSGTKKELCARIRTVKPLETQIDEISEAIQKSGKQVLPPTLIAEIDAVVAKIKDHPILSKWLAEAQTEQRGYYQDPKTGVLVSFVVDAIVNYKGTNIIFDLKFTSDWQPKWFDRSNYEKGRHLLAACYCEGLKAITKTNWEKFVFVAIEPSAPYRIRLYDVDAGMLEAGKSELDYWLNDYYLRVNTNNWSEDQSIKETTLTSWDWEKIKEVVNE